MHMQRKILGANSQEKTSWRKEGARPSQPRNFNPEKISFYGEDRHQNVSHYFQNGSGFPGDSMNSAAPLRNIRQMSFKNEFRTS